MYVDYLKSDDIIIMCIDHADDENELADFAVIVLGRSFFHLVFVIRGEFTSDDVWQG